MTRLDTERRGSPVVPLGSPKKPSLFEDPFPDLVVSQPSRPAPTGSPEEIRQAGAL